MYRVDMLVERFAVGELSFAHLAAVVQRGRRAAHPSRASAQPRGHRRPPWHASARWAAPKGWLLHAFHTVQVLAHRIAAHMILKL